MKDPLYVSIINSTGPYRALARAWVRRALDAGVTNYIIFCADEASFKELRSEGITVRRINKEDHNIPPDWHFSTEVNNKKKDYGALPFLKLVILEELLEEGVPLVYSDVDAFILKDPSLPIKKFLRAHDVLLSTVNHSNAYPKRARDRWQFSLCSGWFVLKGAPSSYKFIQELKKSHVDARFFDSPDKVIKRQAPHLNLQANLNNYVLDRATLQKGDDSASFQIEGVRFKLLDQSFVSRTKFPINSYVYHCLDQRRDCLRRINKLRPVKDNDKS